MRENRKDVERWKKFVKVKVAEGREAEICSVRKDVAGVVGAG
ncbi:hypothetical protein [Blautia sp. MSK20_18]|nr:hypothetical protein [Blautia sp. MSK20_18]